MPPITIRYLPEQIVRAISSSTERRLEHLVFDLVADADARQFDRADGFGSGHGRGQWSGVSGMRMQNDAWSNGRSLWHRSPLTSSRSFIIRSRSTPRRSRSPSPCRRSRRGPARRGPACRWPPAAGRPPGPCVTRWPTLDQRLAGRADVLLQLDAHPVGRQQRVVAAARRCGTAAARASSSAAPSGPCGWPGAAPAAAGLNGGFSQRRFSAASRRLFCVQTFFGSRSSGQE